MAELNKEQEETYQRFKELVNMAPKEIEDWLETDESKKVGQDSGDGESIGHKSGKKIINIKHKKKAELNEDDFSHMHKVIAYISRHTAQKPSGDIKDTNWRYSLMNWGHDPMK